VQSKPLAVLATLLLALALAACGDGGEETTAPQSTEPTSAPQASQQLEQRAEQIEKERRDQAKSGGRKGSGKTASPAPAPAPAEHDDSGGGAAQFHRQGGDNSVQEFGQEGGGSAMESAAAVLHAYLDARVAGRWEDACSYLAADVVASLEQFAAANGSEAQLETCPQILQTLSSGAGAAGLRGAAEVDVGSLRVQGGRGFLLYHGPRGVDFAMPVVLEGGEWRLAAPDATPLL
jgi:hypothetical protein